MNQVNVIGRLVKDVDVRYSNAGTVAEVLRDYTSKGSLIGITGSIQTGKYKKDNGDTVYTTDILVRNIKLLSQKSDQKQTSNAGEFGDFSELEGGDDIPF